MGDLLDVIKNKKHLTSLLVLGIIILALPLVIKLAREQQIIKSRAQGEIIDFRGGTNIEERNGELVAVRPIISFWVFAPNPPQTSVASSPIVFPSQPAPVFPSTAPSVAPVPASETFTISLSRDWNLISFPRRLIKPNLTPAGFEGIGNKVDKIYYSVANNNWLLAKPGFDGNWGGRLDRLDAGKGYWFHAPVATTISVQIAAKNTESLAIPLVVPNSWNMIGYSTQTDQPMDVNAYLSSVGINEWETLYKMVNGSWDSAKKSGGFPTVNVGEGYWVNAGAVTPVPVVPPGQSPGPGPSSPAGGVVCGGACTPENSYASSYICYNISTPQTPQLVWRELSCPWEVGCYCSGGE